MDTSSKGIRQRGRSLIKTLYLFVLLLRRTTVLCQRDEMCKGYFDVGVDEEAAERHQQSSRRSGAREKDPLAAAEGKGKKKSRMEAQAAVERGGKRHAAAAKGTSSKEGEQPWLGRARELRSSLTRCL